MEPGLTGRQFLERLMAGEGTAPLGQLLGFRITRIDDGLAMFEGEPAAAYYNPAGTVHGGWISAILDSALGCAVHTRLEAGASYTTIELKVNMVRAITEATGTVTARGEVIHFGRRIATSHGQLSDAGGRLLAHASCTCLITSS